MALFEDPHLHAETLRLAAGDVLITAGETAKGLFLIESGSFVVTISKAHHELEVGTLGPGDVAGEISLLAGGVAGSDRDSRLAGDGPGGPR